MEHEDNIYGGPQGTVGKGEKEKTTHIITRTHHLMESFDTPVEEITFSLHDKSGKKVGEMELRNSFANHGHSVLYYENRKWSPKEIIHHHKTIKEIKFKIH